jgi:hypothetical protein
MDKFYRQFALRAARHEVLMRHDVLPNKDDTAEMAVLRRRLALAVDDISNLISIVEFLSGEKIRNE